MEEGYSKAWRPSQYLQLHQELWSPQFRVVKVGAEHL